MTSTQLTNAQPAEDTLIDALRGCRDVKELKALEQRLASTTDAPPLFTWICDLLVARRISRGLAARLLLCLLYTSPSPRDKRQSRMPSSA